MSNLLEESSLDDDQRRILHRTARLLGYKIRRGYARELGKNLTPAEKRLWQELQLQQTGGKGWRRQHIIDRFIVDFVHLGAKIVVEADGGYHLDPEQKVLDDDRDEALQEFGWKVLRYTNEDILANAPAIAKSLAELILKRS